MLRHTILVVAALFVMLAGASAASLTVSPIMLNVIAPGNQTLLTVRNEGREALTVQVRVFRWELRNGRDYYLNTQDVVVSPPIARVPARGQLQVRVLRVSRAPVRAEEPYRVVVDEVPDANRVRNVGVNIALRYTLPLFFLNPSASQPRLQWSVQSAGKRRLLVVRNTGDKHVRLTNLSFGSTKLAKGLAGYVLGQSTRTFDLPSRAPRRGRITALTGQGRLNAQVTR